MYISPKPPFGNGITDTEYLGREEQKYITECAKKGWKFVCEYDSIQFFYKIKNDVEPLEIDTLVDKI
ncbi:MAG: DUF2812 domain-containing protein, partial [Alistipes sp.]|nr:DUF2812 domain-containing protein [Alistipes sp.]